MTDYEVHGDEWWSHMIVVYKEAGIGDLYSNWVTWPDPV